MLVVSLMQPSPLSPGSDAFTLGFESHVRLLSQVLALTHEKASNEEKLPYLQSLFAPCPVVGMYGRSAKLGTPCHPSEAVYYGWRDR